MGSRPGNHFYFIWPSTSVAVTRGNVDYRAFLASKVDWGSVIASYLGIPLFLCLWLRFKFINKIKVVKLEECEFDVDYASKHH